MTADSQSPTACLMDCPKSSWAIMIGIMSSSTKLSLFRVCKHLATMAVEHTAKTHVTIHKRTTNLFVLDLVNHATELDLTLEGAISSLYIDLLNKHLIAHLTLRNTIISKDILQKALQLQACTNLLQLTFYSCTFAGLTDADIDTLTQQRLDWCCLGSLHVKFLDYKDGLWGIVKALAPHITHLSVMATWEGPKGSLSICASALSLCINLTHFATNFTMYSGHQLNALLSATQLSDVVLGDLESMLPLVNIEASHWRSLEVLAPELDVRELEHIRGLQRLERFVLHGLSLDEFCLWDLDAYEEGQFYEHIEYLDGLACLVFEEPGTLLVRQEEGDLEEDTDVDVAAAIATVQELIDSHRA